MFAWKWEVKNHSNGIVTGNGIFLFTSMSLNPLQRTKVNLHLNAPLSRSVQMQVPQRFVVVAPRKVCTGMQNVRQCPLTETAGLPQFPKPSVCHIYTWGTSYVPAAMGQCSSCGKGGWKEMLFEIWIDMLKQNSPLTRKGNTVWLSDKKPKLWSMFVPFSEMEAGLYIIHFALWMEPGKGFVGGRMVQGVGWGRAGPWADWTQEGEEPESSTKMFRAVWFCWRRSKYPHGVAGAYPEVISSFLLTCTG